MREVTRFALCEAHMLRVSSAYDEEERLIIAAMMALIYKEEIIYQDPASFIGKKKQCLIVSFQQNRTTPTKYVQVNSCTLVLRSVTKDKLQTMPGLFAESMLLL